VKRIHELTITDDCTTLYNARHMGFILETNFTVRNDITTNFVDFHRSSITSNRVNDTQAIGGFAPAVEIGNAFGRRTAG